MDTIKKTEYVLYQQIGDTRAALFSDQDLEIVHAHRLEATRTAVSSGRARPDMVITRRDCTYPKGKTGEALAHGSTCEETDVHPAPEAPAAANESQPNDQPAL